MPTEYQRYRVLWPLVPAMAMVMIDFTIVSISATTIQSDLHLSETAAQWLVTAYALSTAAFVALGGRLGDIFGHQRIVVTGICLFAGASLMCGLVPDTSGDRRALADHLPRPAGRRRRPPDPLGDGPRPRRLPPGRARQGPGDLLHRRRPLHRDRPGRRLLPDRVLDLAGDLLDQRAGRAALADRVPFRQAQRRQTAGEARLARRRS